MESPTRVRVLWNDATLDRTGWQCRYTTAGGSLRSSPSLKGISAEFRQCWIACTRSTFTASESVRIVTGSIRKLIQRGSNPPIHPEAELEFLRSMGLDEYVRPSALPGDLSVRLEPDVFRDMSSRVLGLHCPEFEPDGEVQLGSGHERQFVTRWVQENLGAGASRWFVPQASLDALTAPLDDYGPSGRRVDFLVHAPFGTPFVVEIDGAQHRDSASPDSERDQLLARMNIEAVRVPTSEIDRGGGPNLDRVRSLWTSPREIADERVADAIMVPPSIHRLAIALLDAVDSGYLRGRTWVVEVEGDPELAPSVKGGEKYRRLSDAVLGIFFA